MSAYRNPPLRRWRVLYRPPLLARFGHEVTFFGSAAVTLLSALLAVIGLIFGGAAGILLLVAGFMVGVTAATLLAITWLTRLPEIAERTISDVAADDRDPARCRVFTGHERWTLPLSPADLSVGQRVRVTYRDVAPRGDLEPGRELLEIRVLDD